MKDTMNFTNTDWNTNVMSTADIDDSTLQIEGSKGISAGGKHRRSKQMFKASMGTSYSTLSNAQPPSRSPMHD